MLGTGTIPLIGYQEVAFGVPPSAETALADGLPPALLDLLACIGQVALQRGQPLYLVGGPVRDLLLRRPVMDIDLVTEGDAVDLARAVAQRFGGQVSAVSQFLTAKVRFPLWTVDLATARREIYPSPGALPVVQPGSIHDDLARRDFTINAIAIDLTPARWGHLLDPFGGYGDVQGRLVRILHDRSFQDDATRILRALRYEQRLGFALEAHTCYALKRDRGFLDTISGDRLRREVERVFQEPMPERVLGRAHDLGVLGSLFPGLQWGEEHRQALIRWREEGREVSPLLFLALLAYPLSLERAEALVRRLRLPRRWAEVVRHTLQAREIVARWASPPRPSQVIESLAPLRPEAVEACAILSTEQAHRQTLRAYLDTWRSLRPRLSAMDLLALGVPQGPWVGRLLAELRARVADGLLATEEEERAYVRRRLHTLKEEP
ncbi:CCA-adding enzyme [bacterium HR23]|nr:CCA-adding enzyme [bacterium HR23]